MPMDEEAARALAVGREQAREVLALRDEALERRAAALAENDEVLEIRTETLAAATETMLRAEVARTAGVLVAEGDSWFDYPFHDILQILEDDHGYDVEEVAHRGDPIEEMAYGGNQLEELTRKLEKLLRNGKVPKAILLSGGGNDVAGAEFAMLLNHARSADAGLNAQVLAGVIDRRIRAAYITVLAAVSRVCEEKLGRLLPILVHGYDFPVPDGRGVLGGFWVLPGPWLEPGFRLKGYTELARRKALARELIDRFNAMLDDVTSLPAFDHVQHIDLRNTLSTDDGDYEEFWANELHPTRRGFRLVTDRFVQALRTLP